MSANIYLEGGGDSKELHIRCREGFRKLLENAGFKGRLPRLTACGGRDAAFGDFQTGHATKGDSDLECRGRNREWGLKMRIPIPCIAVLLTSFTTLHAAEAPKPLKVFILAGQSNMEGQG